jgi:uncharacterized protein YcbK (DUF882 family)
MADTQQERERIHGSILASTRQKPDPITLTSLASRFASSDEGTETIALSVEGAASEVLTQAPVRVAPPIPEGKKVFTDPRQWEQIIDQAPEEGKPLSFKQAFTQARKAGQEGFEYHGDRFHTREKGESGAEWAQYLTGGLAPEIAATPSQEGYGRREDGTEKGEGWLGLIPMQDGSDRMMSEVSVGVEIDGEETLVPAIVPALSEDEVSYLAQGGDAREHQSIMNKAVSHAKEQLAGGNSPFAPEEPGTEIMSGLNPRDKSRMRMSAEAFRQSRQPNEVAEATEPVFTDFMERAGVQVAQGKDIDVKNLSAELGPAIEEIAPILREAGITPEITSGRRDRGDWSLHEIGEAVDFRLKNASSSAIKKLTDSLPGEGIKVKVHGQKGKLWRKGDFEYILHGSGNNVHLHIERDNRETKESLADHLKVSGKTSSISRRGLRAHAGLIEKYFPDKESA